MKSVPSSILSAFRSRFVLSVSLGLCFVIAASSCRCQSDKASAENLILGTRAIDGREFNANSSKLIVLNFWASWCGPCIQETPSLMRWANQHADKITLIAVSEDDSLKEVKNFLRLYPMAEAKNIFMVHDLDRRLSLGFGVNKFPETLIFDQHFRLVKKVEGAIDWSTIEPSEFIK